MDRKQATIILKLAQEIVDKIEPKGGGGHLRGNGFRKALSIANGKPSKRLR